MTISSYQGFLFLSPYSFVVFSCVFFFSPSFFLHWGVSFLEDSYDLSSVF